MSRRSPSTRLALAALTAICACAACATQTARPQSDAAEHPADAETQARVRAALANDPSLSGRMIQVWVESGVVHLRGFVESTDDLLLARGDATSVPNVVAVDEEQLAIIHGGTPP